MTERTSRAQTAGRALAAPALLALLAVPVYLVPELGEVLELRPQAVSSDQLWRLLTCHWAHWSLDHLMLDAVALVAVGSVHRLRGGRLMGLTIACAAALIGGWVWLLEPGLASYRGLSGPASAVTVLLAVSLLRHCRPWRERPLDAMAPGLAVLGLIAKVGYEQQSGRAAFVDSVADGFVPVPMVHLLGGVVGLVVALLAEPITGWIDRLRTRWLTLSLVTGSRERGWLEKVEHAELAEAEQRAGAVDDRRTDLDGCCSGLVPGRHPDASCADHPRSAVA